MGRENLAERESPLFRGIWQSCGFLLTEYVHHYVWVPETYRAIYLPLIADSRKTTGEELFVYINTFHRLSFRGGGKEES
jgi:hypothetical protein